MPTRSHPQNVGEGGVGRYQLWNRDLNTQLLEVQASVPGLSLLMDFVLHSDPPFGLPSHAARGALGLSLQGKP